MGHDIPTPLVREHDKIVAGLGELGFALPGTMTQRMMSCGKPNCRCHDNPDLRHGPYFQWTRTVDGKTVTKQLSRGQLDRYQPWFDNNRRLRDLVDRLQTASVDAIMAAEGWGAES